MRTAEATRRSPLPRGTEPPPRAATLAALGVFAGALRRGARKQLPGACAKWPKSTTRRGQHLHDARVAKPATGGELGADVVEVCSRPRLVREGRATGPRVLGDISSDLMADYDCASVPGAFCVGQDFRIPICAFG